MSERDYCGECGEPLKVLPHGAYLQCCHGAGYWSAVGHVSRDSWGAHCMARSGKLRLYVRKPEFRFVFPKVDA